MRKILMSLGIGMAILLTGCASYQANSLSPLNPEHVRTYENMEGISIGCKAYTVEDCYNYLDRNVIAKGYQPVQLTFYNQSNKSYLFSTKGVSLICASPKEVARTVHTSTAGRVTGYTLGGLGGILVLPSTFPLFIPAIVDGIKSSNANGALDADFSVKAKDSFEIRPNSYSTTLVFVPKAYYTPIFELSLSDQKTGESKVVALSAVQ